MLITHEGKKEITWEITKTHCLRKKLETRQGKKKRLSPTLVEIKKSESLLKKEHYKIQKETWAIISEKANLVSTFTEITGQMVLKQWPLSIWVLKTLMNNQIHCKYRVTFWDHFLSSIFITCKSKKDNGQRKKTKTNAFEHEKCEVSFQQLRTRQHSGVTSPDLETGFKFWLHPFLS